MPIQHQMATPNPTQMYSHIYQGATPTMSSNPVPPISGGIAMSPQHQQQVYQQNTSQQQMPPMQVRIHRNKLANYIIVISVSHLQVFINFLESLP